MFIAQIIIRFLSLTGRSDANQQLKCYSTNIQEGTGNECWIEVATQGGAEDDPADEATGSVKRMINAIEPVKYYGDHPALKTDTIEYLAGFITFACKTGVKVDEDDEDESCDNIDRTFLDIINEGGLKKPPTKIVRDVERLETVFRNVPLTTNNILDVLLTKLPKLAAINTDAALG